jgi:hypothetical protein
MAATGSTAVDNPFLFKTKTEVVASLAPHQAAHLIGSTCSCSHSMFQTKTQRHCGRCSQCIDRRFATLAAELQSCDSSKDYVSDVFIGPRNDPLEKAIAIDYVQHGLELAQKSENELAASFNTELSRAVRHVEARSQAAREIISMHKRHGDVVSRVLEQQIHENAAGFVAGTLDPTCLLAMVARRNHLSGNDHSLAWAPEEANVKGEGTPSPSDPVPAAALLRVEASLQSLHEKIDAVPVRKATKKTRAKPGRRDSIIFAAILLGLKGMMYCSLLKDCGVKPKWSEPYPINYCAGYQAGNPWRKKIQDEKSRAKARMEGYTDPALADAFNFYLPERFKELSRLLNSRNSRHASKNPTTAKPPKR